jgi:hypothetical protein
MSAAAGTPGSPHNRPTKPLIEGGKPLIEGGKPLIEGGRLQVAATLQLEESADPGFHRVFVDGRHAGSVRLQSAGWVPLGAFVFSPGLEPRYFVSPESAAMALAKALLKRRSAVSKL